MFNCRSLASFFSELENWNESCFLFDVSFLASFYPSPFPRLLCSKYLHLNVSRSVQSCYEQISSFPSPSLFVDIFIPIGITSPFNIILILFHYRYHPHTCIHIYTYIHTYSVHTIIYHRYLVRI